MDSFLLNLTALYSQLITNEMWLFFTVLAVFLVLITITWQVTKAPKYNPVKRNYQQPKIVIQGLRNFVRQQTLPLSDHAQIALEDELMSRDISPSIASRIAVNIRRRLAKPQTGSNQDGALMAALTVELSHLLDNSNEFKNIAQMADQQEFDWIASGQTNVIMMCGVNGAGKTSTLAKLTHRLQQQNYSVMLVAGDTFRAGAIEQINAWAEKLQVPLIKQAYGANPAAVIKDALRSAQAKKIDVLIVDTSGRQDNRNDLLEQLQRNQQVVTGTISQHRTYLVLDGTNGRNSLNQVEKYAAKLDVSGLIITKLDTVASGGGLLESPKQIPITYLTFGEELTDIQLYDKQSFINFILGD